MSERGDTIDWISLGLVPGLGAVGALRLVDYFGSPAAVLTARPAARAAVAGIRSSQLAGFGDVDQWRRRAAEQLAGVRSIGGDVLGFDDDRYPSLLREIPDPPLALWALGNPELLSRVGVGIVGSRAATSYGRRAAGKLAAELADYGVTVVSGMALGIDSEAHLGALRRAGDTIAVLGSGIDCIYPPQNRHLYEDIRQSGLIVSEYPMGTRPDGFRFPARNRIIAGLCRGIVVVEAAKKSGSLITAQLALDFGREIFAVPGQIDSMKSEGANWLLREGAKLVASAGDIVEELQLVIEGVGSSHIGTATPAGLDPGAVELLRQLEPYPLSQDEVSQRTGLSPARLSELLLYLELEGCIEIVTGGLVRRLQDGGGEDPS